MQAFPMGSKNNALGGSGPLNNNINIDQFRGHGMPEGYSDYATSGIDQYRKRPSAERQLSFNPTDRVELVHGSETVGLGTSTFLEGAPASRTAIQRRESQTEDMATGGGLSRKKSLAQRIRGMSGSRGGAPGRMDRYGNIDGSSPESPQARYAQSAGGPTKMNETNPFFDDYDEAYERKGATIKISEDAKTARPRAPSSPMRGLERRRTTDSAEGETAIKTGGGGFLNRVRSLKGGRRSRPERPT